MSSLVRPLLRLPDDDTVTETFSGRVEIEGEIGNRRLSRLPLQARSHPQGNRGVVRSGQGMAGTDWTGSWGDPFIGVQTLSVL